MKGNRVGLGNGLAGRSTECRGKVHSVPNDRGMRCSEDGDGHLVGDCLKPVGEELAINHIRTSTWLARRGACAPRHDELSLRTSASVSCRRTTQSGGTTTV